ncbi:MAG: tetratricopeptide repeat protein [Paramuribaculum sp.]|nr:tetratricopeptide repeat protein [Paramuribaculum sp.]
MTIVLAFALRSHGANSYDSVAAKASRFYAQKEWRSALAMYYLMIDERPDDCGTYARAIAVAGMVDDTAAQKRLTEAAFARRIGVDSLFSGVSVEAISLGNADILERYLIDVVTYEPWLDRVAGAGLLKYYLFRCNGPKTVEYAEKMLRGLPGDIGFMKALAQGYLDSNNLPEAEKVYRTILAKDADNEEALLYLGNAALGRGDKKAGAEYLRRAVGLNPTPYLNKILSELTAQDRR